MKTLQEIRAAYPIGSRVRFIAPHDVYPDAYVDADELGWVARIENREGAWEMFVLLDAHHDGLGEWHNCVSLWGDNFDDEHPVGETLLRVDDIGGAVFKRALAQRALDLATKSIQEVLGADADLAKDFFNDRPTLANLTEYVATELADLAHSLPHGDAS